MPYSIAEQAPWTGDQALFASLDGATALTAWFGFLHDMHDATIQSMRFDGSSGLLVFSAFRMTRQVDDQGHLVLDRPARVAFHFDGVRGVVLDFNPATTAVEVGVRRVCATGLRRQTMQAQAGDYEFGIDEVCGGSGSIFANSIRISVEPGDA